MAIAMEADERVFLMGEDIGVYGGAFQVTGDLVERFGRRRVMDTPISELGGAGVAVGAALTGMRPIFEFQFSDFATLAMEQIVNQAAKMRFMLGGEVSVPLVMRFPGGSGTGAAAQHSQSLEAWFGHVPGLKVMQPATPHDAKGMLLAAIDDPDPVMIFEHKLLYKMKGPVPEGHYTVPIGKAEIRREGTDLTIVATSIMVHKALEAAETLAGGRHRHRGRRSAHHPADGQGHHHRERQEDIAAAVRLRGGEDARHRRGSQRDDRRERGVRLSRCADRAAWAAPKRRSPTIPSSRRRRCRRFPAFCGAPAIWLAGNVRPCLSKSSCPRSTWTWRPARSRAGSSPRVTAVTKGDLLFEIETDKAAMEVDAPSVGHSARCRRQEGDDSSGGPGRGVDLCRRRESTRGGTRQGAGRGNLSWPKKQSLPFNRPKLRR